MAFSEACRPLAIAAVVLAVAACAQAAAPVSAANGDYILVSGSSCASSMKIATEHSSMQKDGTSCTSGGQNRKESWAQVYSKLMYQAQKSRTATPADKMDIADSITAIFARGQDSRPLVCGESSATVNDVYTWVDNPNDSFLSGKVPNAVSGSDGTIFMQVFSPPAGYNALAVEAQSTFFVLPQGGCWYKKGTGASSQLPSPSLVPQQASATEFPNSAAEKDAASGTDLSVPAPNDETIPKGNSIPTSEASTTPATVATGGAKTRASLATSGDEESTTTANGAKGTERSTPEHPKSAGKTSSGTAPKKPAKTKNAPSATDEDDGGDRDLVVPESSSPEGEDASCFPADATVELEDGSVVTMADLSIGDYVKVGLNKFSKVFMFTHRTAEAHSRFVSIETASGLSLEVTDGHYLYIEGNLRAASDVRVGSTVILGNGAIDTVVNVHMKMGTGLYNPQTENGDIVVNGVVSSTYTTAVDPEIAHAILSPFRFLSNLGFRITAFEAGGGILTNLMRSGRVAF